MSKYWIKLGMADWLEVDDFDYFSHEKCFSDIEPGDQPSPEWSGIGNIQGRITDEPLSEFTLDNQADFQPFVKLKTGKREDSKHS